MSEAEYLETLIEEDPFGEATELDWEDFWAQDAYIEELFDDDFYNEED